MELSQYLILIIAALVTSTISGVFGMLGGIALIAVMGEFFTPAILIPLHGIVQLSSNSLRTVVNFEHVHKKTIFRFAIGVLIGALVGSQFVVAIPENIYKIVLGSFLIVFTWMPKIKTFPIFKYKFIFLGAIASFLSLFVGATGPLIAPFFIREKFNRLELVGTKAACQTFVHTGKVITFFALGFTVGPYWKLLLGMVIATFFGNVFGKMLLGKLNENVFRVFFKIIITALALRMLIQI